MAHVDSVNLGRPQPNPYKRVPGKKMATGIGKQPHPGPVEVRAPGPKHDGLGSGLVGDFIGDTRHHGGDDQAVYAFAREDLDRWQERLAHKLPNGFFGENLTTIDVDLAETRVGERWQVGDEVTLRVTSPRIPCSTFRGWVGRRGWLKSFTADARPGAYLEVISPGRLRAGDPITVLHRPEHDVTVSMMFRALTTERELLPVLLNAKADLGFETLAAAEKAAAGIPA